jgi:LAGLIDADG endonuclease
VGQRGLQRYYSALGDDYPRDLVTDEFGHWLAGFIAGEATFSFSTRRRGERLEYTPRLGLRVRGDDRAILEEIRASTGVGTVWSVKKRTHTDQAEWLVSSLPDCMKLVGLLDKYPLRAKKAEDFRVWREAVRELHAGSAPRGGTRMAELKAQLEAVAGRRSRARTVGG